MNPGKNNAFILGFLIKTIGGVGGLYFGYNNSFFEWNKPTSTTVASWLGWRIPYFGFISGGYQILKKEN